MGRPVLIFYTGEMGGKITLLFAKSHTLYYIRSVSFFCFSIRDDLFMIKIRFFLLILLGTVLCGCFSPRELKSYDINIKRAELSASGTLEIEGNYLEKSWGISDLRGKVSGDAIILYGSAEYGKDNRIYYRIPKLPSGINQIRIGKKTIWNRLEKAAALPAVEKKSEEKSVKQNEEKKITHLRIGRNAAVPPTVNFTEFTEIFWRSKVRENSSGTQIKFQDVLNPDAGQLNDLSDLEILEIFGTPSLRNIDFSGIKLPNLKKLVLYDIEVSGLEKASFPSLQEFRIDDFRQVPLGKVSLPENLPELSSVSIQAFAGNFNFETLRGKPVKKLKIHGDFGKMGFLSGMPVEELKLSGFRSMPGELEILSSLPLKKLKLSSSRVSQWGFLRGMKLNFLDIEVIGANDFSPELLRGMPLETLRIYSNRRDWGKEWQKCGKLPLKEFILKGGVVPEKFLLHAKIEKLALLNCFWGDTDPVMFFSRMPELKHLAVWKIIGKKSDVPIDYSVRWHRIGNKKLESLRVTAKNVNFVKFFPSLTRLAVQQQGKYKISLFPLANRTFECLLFDYDKRELQRHNIKLLHNSF